MTLIILALCPPIMAFLPFVWALLILYRPKNSDKRVALVSRLVVLEAAVGATAAADVIYVPCSYSCNNITMTRITVWCDDVLAGVPSLDQSFA